MLVVRTNRAPALLIAALMTVTLLGGCSTDDSKPDLAAQDKLVQLGNRLAAAHARVAQARRLVARQRRAAVLLTQQRTRVVIPAARRVGQSGFSLDRICAPIPRGGRRASRLAARQRERQRKRALYYLNLSCPPVRS
jgi:hypothetical protein